MEYNKFDFLPEGKVGTYWANTSSNSLESKLIREGNPDDYIIENNATVRRTAKQFGISKSTVHTDVTK